jgi:hypothetical protein
LRRERDMKLRLLDLGRLEYDEGFPRREEFYD